MFLEKQESKKIGILFFDPTTLPEKQLLVYGIISSHPGLNAKQISEMLTLKKSSIETAIKGLRKKEIIEYEGTTRNGGYIIKIIL